MDRRWILALAIGATGCDIVFQLAGVPPVPPPDAPPPPSAWAQVSAGTLHTCGIHMDGTLWCWGRNDSGQLGTSASDIEIDTPKQVGADTWSVVSAGGSHTCAIEAADQSLWCWGKDATGQLGNNAIAAAVFEPTQVAGAWLAVAAGATHTCAIKTADQSMWCWGTDVAGEGGDADFGATHMIPTPVSSSGQWISVTAGDNVSCGLQSDHTAWCWGEGSFGEIGNGIAADAVTPMQSGAPTDTWQHITVNNHTVCAIRTAGMLACWGDNTFGQLGNDSTTNSPTPVEVEHDDASWIDVATGRAHACGLHADGSLYCWGSNAVGQLASTTAEAFRSNPLAVTAPAGPWLAVALGDRTTCAIDGGRQLWCAGLDDAALGTADGGSRRTPVKIGAANFIAVGGDFYNDAGGTACSIDAANVGHMSCWGYNGEGSVGDGTLIDRSVPTMLAGMWRGVSVGDHACAVDMGNQLSCWGANFFGQIGNGVSNSLQLTPLIVPSPAADTEWRAAGVRTHSCGIDSAKKVSCWGLNEFGEIGEDPALAPMATTPVLLMSADTWTLIGTGITHSCGIGTLGVQCWGDDTFGQSGGQAGFLPSVVANLPNNTNGVYDSLAVGGDHTCAGSGTTFYCWGYNANGQLGNQSVTSTASPIAAGTWAQLTAGHAHTCAVAVDGSLSCWGANNYGQLGDGTFLEHHEPQPVGTDSDWASVAAGVANTCATKQNGDLYCWGRNREGEVGDGAAWRTTLIVVP